MRNLKRALSLTLASVMLLGMMVVGSSAAAGYDDVKDTDNVEAIEVLQEIEVMVGDERGFGPDRPVNRAEMAVVMGKLLNLDYNYYESACPFTDVSGNYAWAKGWVGAAYANKILSGRSATVFDPGATVTAVEAASMMMRALGYFQYAEDVADGFVLATVKQGTDIGIFNGVGSDGNTAMTRNQVAQMALNALRSEMVTFTGTPGVDVNGVKVGYRAEYSPRTGTEAKYNSIASLTTTLGRDESRYYIQLGEQLYDGDLKLYDRDLDAFDRPARTWEYKGEQIGTYVKNELLRKAYSVKVTGKDLYDLLTKNTIDTYKFVISVDGVDTTDTNARTLLDSAWFDTSYMTRTYTDKVGETDKGVTTEVYVDTRNEVVYIAVINTYLAIADDDYDEKDDELDLTIYNIDEKNNSVRNPIYVKDDTTDEIGVTVSGEDFAIEDVKDEDKFLVQVAQGEIQTMWKPEILSEVIIDAFKLNSYVSTGGEQYDHDDTARYDVEVLDQYDVTNLKETTYNVILDQYGYLIGLERNSDPDQYVFLTGIDSGASNLYATRADANVIHTDGTMETVKVDLTKSRSSLSGTNRLLTDAITGARNKSQVNVWCKYSVSDDGVYTLKMVPIATTTDVRPAKAPKVAQFAQDVNVYDDHLNGNATAGEKEINEKRVSLIGYDTNNYGTLDSGEVYVYGNDDTVYINVTLDDVTVDDKTGGEKRCIVDDVDSVVTGVKNVNLVMKNLPANSKAGYINPAAEIYTLYNDKGIVIAAVTIGEDNGTATNYAYITGDIDREEYGHKTSSKATEGKWTWYRDAIVDGKKTRLTETGDTIDVLDTLNVGEWYEIRYNADGDVRRAKSIGTAGADLVYSSDGTGKYVNQATLVEKAVNSGNNTVLLHDITTVDALTFKNGTLYTDVNATKGFSVGSDVKVVVINANKAGTKWMDSVTDGYTGYTGVEKAIKDMNCRGTGSDTTGTALGRGVTTKWIELSAIMTNGFASVIVINDKSPDLGGTTPVAPPAGGKITVEPKTTVTQTGNVISIHVPVIDTAGNATNLVEVNAAVQNALLEKGYFAGSSLTSAALSGTVTTPVTLTAMKMDGTGVAIVRVTYQNFVTLKFDDGTVVKTVEWIPYDTASVTETADIKGTGTGYLDAAGSYQTYTTSTGTPVRAAGSNKTSATIKTGYVKVDQTVVASGGTVGGTGLATTDVTCDVTTPATATEAKAGSDVKVTVTVAGSKTTDAKNDITLTYKLTLPDKPQETKTLTEVWELPIGSTGSGVTHEFTIANVQGDIDDVQAMVNGHEDAHAITVKFTETTPGTADDNANGMTAKINTASFSNVKKNETVTGSVTISKTDAAVNPTGAIKITLSGGSWVSGDTNGTSVKLNSDTKIVELTADALIDGNVTVRFQFKSNSTNAENVTVKVEANP